MRLSFGPRDLGIALICALVVGCAPDAVGPNGSKPVTPTGALSASLRTNPSVAGHKTSIRVEYRSNAPVDRLDRVMQFPVGWGFDSRRHHHLSLDVADSAVSRVITQLSQEPWVSSVRVRTIDETGITTRSYGRTGRASMIADAYRSLLRRSDAVPWGVNFTNGQLVASLFGNTGTGVKVGVLDTGIDCDNSDFGTVHDVDETGDGWTYCDDPKHHGTMVAGVIAAGSDGSGVVGMAPGVSLYSIRIGDQDGAFNPGHTEAGLVWAIDSGMQVINLSIADCGRNNLDSDVATAIDDAVSAGIVVVAAAGNGMYQSGCSSSDSVSDYVRTGVIGVAAVNHDSSSPSGFMYGSRVFIAAPQYVTSDSITGLTATDGFAGTSAATPHVAGAAALLVHQGLNASQVRTRLSYETQNKPDTTVVVSFNHTKGSGILDALAAVEPTPEIWDFGVTGTGCDGHLHVGAACTVTPSLGIAGFGTVTYTWSLESDISDGAASTSDSTSPTLSFTVTGDTTAVGWIYVIAWPHDSVTSRQKRTGLESVITFEVCPGGTVYRYAPPSSSQPMMNAVASIPIVAQTFIARPLALPSLAVRLSPTRSRVHPDAICTT